MEQNLKSIEHFIEEVNKETRKMQLPETVSDIRSTVNSIHNSKDEFMQAVKKLETTLNSIKLLVDSIDQDPQQFIRGKAKPEVFKK
jgi:hypothetical protein